MAKVRKTKGKACSVNKVTVGDTVALSNGAIAKVVGMSPFRQQVLRTCEGSVVTFQVIEGDMKNANFDGVFLSDDEVEVVTKNAPSRMTRVYSALRKILGSSDGKGAINVTPTPPALPAWDNVNQKWKV